MRLAIADPPYPPRFSERRRVDGSLRVVASSRARRYYGNGTRPSAEVPADFHQDAGEWDSPERHRRLLDDLLSNYDGWVIATTSDGLECYRPLPLPARVMAWVKPTAPAGAHRLRSTWEAVIVYLPESRRGGRGRFSDVLVTNAPGGGFAGAKPERWTRWVLDALGYDPATDTVDDLFPGSGMVSNAITQGVLL